jgi:hypothetical protein
LSAAKSGSDPNGSNAHPGFRKLKPGYACLLLFIVIAGFGFAV